MNVLVTGSKGVVGTALVKNLKAADHNVIEVEHDLRTRHVLDQYFEKNKIDFVVLLAFGSVGSKFKFDVNYMSDNTRLMDYTFETIGKYKVPFIHISSQMANMTHNPYAVLKRVGDFYTEYLGGINVKLWNVYGPQKVSAKSHVFTDFIEQARTKREIRMITSGAETRQFIHCDDLARALTKIVDNFETCKSSFGNSIDISSFEWITVRELADMIAEMVGPDVRVIPGDSPVMSHTKVNEPSTAFLQSGWEPRISIREGIRALINDPPVVDGPIAPRKITEPVENRLASMLQNVISGKGDSDKHIMSLFGIAVGSGAKNILELGVRSGVTTLPLLLAAQANGGRLTSVDIGPTNFKAPDDLSPYWTFVQSDAIKFLENTKDTPYDLVFVDDWHAYSHVKKELELLDAMVTPKSIILLHDLMYGNNEPRYHCDLTLKDGQWAEGGPYRAVAELNDQFWEFSTLPVNNGLTILRKKYSSRYYS